MDINNPAQYSQNLIVNSPSILWWLLKADNHANVIDCAKKYNADTIKKITATVRIFE
jgi:hypothetical protein